MNGTRRQVAWVNGRAVIRSSQAKQRGVAASSVCDSLCVTARMVQADDLDVAGIAVHGDASAPSRLFAVLQEPDPDFPILTPADAT